MLNSFWLNPVGVVDADADADADNALAPLHFVHGNSFPTGSYRTMLTHLKQHYQIHALDMHGHNPNYPVTDGWTLLCDELIASIEKNPRKPVILVGHSFGGVISLMAAKLRPDLVRCVVMLDSPVIAGWRAKLLNFGKKTGIDFFFSPAKNSIKRRKSWPDRDAVFEHFANKDMFGIWPEEVLRDYVEYGVEPYPNGVTLRYKRDVETAIYRTLPHATSRYCALPFPVPIGCIVGSNSVECRQIGMKHTKNLVGENLVEIEGSHLYPFESPKMTADAVQSMINNLLNNHCCQR